MDPTEYRRLQLDAVSGNSGTTEWEVLLATCWPLVAIFFWNTIRRQCGDEVIKYLSSFPAQFIVFLAPLIPSFLFPSANPILLLLFTTLPCILLILFSKKMTKSPSTNTNNIYLPQVTNARASIMSMCTLGIIAVDFSPFPRRFAKTETFGVSLMDVGVGTVIFSLGLTAARTKWSWKSIKSTIPMLILGFIRMALVRGVEYHVHESEYGIHWNFFVTLGLLPLLVTVSSKLLPRVSFTLQAIVLIIVYQLCLSYCNLQEYLLDNERLPFSFVSQNKEGIFSLMGYFSLFLMSIDVGRDIFQRRRSNLFAKFLIFTIAYAIIKTILNIQPSRRLANLPFVLAIQSFSLLHMLIFNYLEDWLGDGRSVPPIYSAISSNQLAFFLIGNVITGMINLFCYTLLQPTFIAVILLVVYLLILGAINTIFSNCNIKIKL